MTIALPVVRQRRFAPVLLQLYRLGVLLAIIFVVHHHRMQLQVVGDRPITLKEVQAVFPKAAKLEADGSERAGLHVLDEAGRIIGYVAATQPVAEKIIGYAGPTDGLLCFGVDGKLVKLIIRWSADTKEHVSDVATDRYFMQKLWPGRTWEELAQLDLQKAGIEGVSGATLTSMALAESIVYRTKWSEDRTHQPPMRLRAADIGTAIVIVLALLMTFTHLRGKTWLRRAFQVVVIGYIGFYTGHLLAQSLFAGWTVAGVAWRMAPGLALLAGAALVLPWSTRRQTYCSHICPHGAAQELVGRLTKKKLKIRHDIAAGLRWLPFGLLVIVIGVTMLRLHEVFDLAWIEPFDAYLIRSAGWATITIAVVGLVAAVFIPQAYCKYGCPTGMLLDFVRSHGQADRFSRKDLGGLVLLAIAVLFHVQHATFMHWITGR